MTNVNPLSLTQSLEAWEKTNLEEKYLIGRKYGNYLVYHETKGWSVKRLNIFQQFLRNCLSCFGFYKETRLSSLYQANVEVLANDSLNPIIAKIKRQFLLKSTMANLDKTYLDKLNALVARKPKYQSEITKFGDGTRSKYPESEWREKLKREGQKTDLTGYQPVLFTADVVKNSVWGPGKQPKDAWADPENPEEIAEQIQAGRKRVTGAYKKQTNPMGKTGITGQGELGLHGANPAADPIVFALLDGKLKVLLIKRQDNGQWAIPGGMLDPTDPNISATATRELGEETGMNYDQLKANGNLVELGQIYSGYSNDPRNTDTSWMTTTAFSYLVNPSALKKEKIVAADDATACAWVDVEEVLDGKRALFASHEPFIFDAVRNFLEKGKRA